MPVKFEASALTDQGRLRKANEDTVFQKAIGTSDEDAVGLFVVADGVGGRLAGEVASYWAVETIKSSLADFIDYRDPRATHRFTRDEILGRQAALMNGSDLNKMKNRVEAAVKKANTVVREYTRQKPDEARNASSTLCLALVYGLQAIVANVGDSRAYLLRGGQLNQITKDHSLVQKLVDEGHLQADEVYTHPHRHVIYRSIGSKESVDADISALELALGDHLLLCTDGLWEMINNPNDIANIIRGTSSVQAACQQLVAVANDAGGVDNIGVVLVRVYE